MRQCLIAGLDGGRRKMRGGAGAQTRCVHRVVGCQDETNTQVTLLKGEVRMELTVESRKRV